MTTTLHVSSLLLLLAAGCGAVPTASVNLGSGGHITVDATRSAGQLRESAETPAGSPAGSTASPVGPRAQDPAAWLDIWHDVSFRRRFAESYFPDNEVEPRLDDVERASMQQVMSAIASGKLDWAENLVQSTVSPTSSAMFEFTLGNIHFQREALTAAASGYRDAIEKFPKFRRAWKNLGICYVRQSDFASAARAFAKVIEQGGADALTYGLLAYAYAMIDDHVAAESAYRMAVLLDPDLLDWKMGLARSLFKQERFADVAALLDHMLTANSHRSDLWLLQANAFLGMNRPERAAENFEIVDHLGQSTAESLNTLGDIYCNSEMFELAASAYERALDKDTGSSASKATRNAKVLVKRGATEEGARLIARIETKFAAGLTEADRKELLKLRALVAVASNADEEQAGILEEIVRLDPLDGEALILLGQHHARHDRLDRAALYYVNAANVPGFEVDAKVRHAQLLVREGKYAEALPLLRRAQALQPRDHVQEWLEKVERYAQGRQ